MVQCIRWRGRHAIMRPPSTTGGVLQAELVLMYKARVRGGGANQSLKPILEWLSRYLCWQLSVNSGDSGPLH